MKPIILPGEQGTPAWRAAKAGRITGTRFAAAMSKKDTAGYQNLITDLAWERVFGADDPSSHYTSKFMQEGIDREPESIDWYRFVSDVECFQPMFVIHGEHDFIGCSPDLLREDDGMAQIKNPGRAAHLKVMHDRKLPAQYRWQVQGEILVCARAWSDFVSYMPQMAGEIVRVEASQADHEALLAECLVVNEKADALAERIRQRRAA